MILAALLISMPACSSLAACLSYSSVTLDEHGNGSFFTITDTFYCTGTTTPLPYEVLPDPSGGIPGRPVLIYSLSSVPFNGLGGDVALVSTNGVIHHVIRFFVDKAIFYADDHSGSLSDVGLPRLGSYTSLSLNPAGVASISTAPLGLTVDYTFITEPYSPPFILSTNKLEISPGSNAVTLAWSTNAADFGLYEATNIYAASNWTAVTNVPVISNDEYTVTLPTPPTVTAHFFRLKQQ